MAPTYLRRLGLLGLLCGGFTVQPLTVAQAQTTDAFNPNANDTVAAIAIQTDGKIIVGGAFTQIGGQNRNRLARLNQDGTLDLTFTPSANNTVYALTLQPDGRCLVGGDFTSLAGGARSGIGRLLPQGTLDNTFTAPPDPSPYFQSFRAQAMAMQPDGKIVVSGRVTIQPPGFPLMTLGSNQRVQTNGVADSSFSTTNGVNGPVTTTLLQPDGKILLGGLFTTLRGITRNRLGRLHSDGTLDTNFNPNVNSSVFAVAVQRDEKILVAGAFTSIGGVARTNIARLNNDGSVDPTFTVSITGGASVVQTLVVQADGRILAGGNFTVVNGVARMGLVRLNPDGSVDLSFNASAFSVVGLAMDATGRILVGGDFTSLASQPRSRMGRLNNTYSVSESLSDDGNTITWMRGGSSPEVWRTTFEISANLTNWVSLGEGIRINGGWQLGGLALPPGERVRARGFASGGLHNGSSWFTETISGSPWFITEPANRTNNAGTIATFSPTLGGSPPFTYQWQKGTNTISDGTFIFGSTGPTLALSNVLGADAGGYSLIASNSYGSVTSMVATLEVIDPVITSTLTTNSADAGDTVTVSVAANGTPPLTYEWRKNGMGIPGANGSSLTLSNVGSLDIGTYSVTVSSAFGSASMNRMVLEVNLAEPHPPLPLFDEPVYGVSQQPDGRLIVSGSFQMVGGTFRPIIARIGLDEMLDPTFDPGTNISGIIFYLSARPDGKVVAGGSFTIAQGATTRYNLVRFNPDGSLDGDFNPDAGSVQAMAAQPDGKVVLGVSSVAGGPVPFLARIHENGSRDTNFFASASDTVRCLGVQTDGKILVMGAFANLNNTYRQCIARLNFDGTIDSSFQTQGNPSFEPGANYPVNCMAPQADGKIVIGGEFTTVGGATRSYIARLNTDGTLDSAFKPDATYYANGRLVSLTTQADGKIIATGVFSSIGGKPRNNLARLLPDGSADPAFNVGVSHNLYVPIVSAITLANGNNAVAGQFTDIDEHACTNLAILQATDMAGEVLTSTNSSINWRRTGTAPELWSASFDTSDDGTNWTSLGVGVRIPEGWQLNTEEPIGLFLRARGEASGAYHSSSSSTVMQTTMTRAMFDTRHNFGFRTNGFQLSVLGPANRLFVIETSSNLFHWMPLITNLAGAEGFEFLDQSATNVPARFYRTRQE